MSQDKIWRISDALEKIAWQFKRYNDYIEKRDCRHKWIQRYVTVGDHEEPTGSFKCEKCGEVDDIL